MALYPWESTPLEAKTLRDLLFVDRLDAPTAGDREGVNFGIKRAKCCLRVSRM